MGQVQGILVPGGFGQRGMEGKIVAIRYAREERVPYLGICLGMQLAIIEFARHVAGVEEATGQEFSESGQWVVHYMPGQGKETPKGGSMRLGAYACELYEGTLAHRIYGEADGKIRERHRHRMEVNNAYLDDFKKKGLVVSGVNRELGLVEVIELENHPFFVGCQYHPEFKSRPHAPHPLFRAFLESADRLNGGGTL